MTQTPVPMERYTKNERSLFLKATIPVTNAIISMIDVMPTVTSHQVSSNESVLKTKTSSNEAAIMTKNTMFNPADHLPNVVFGIGGS